MSKIGILTVAYLKTLAHKNLAIKTYESMPMLYRLCVVNANDVGLDLANYNNEIIENDQNCFARALNIGLEYYFDQEKYDYVVISNLDLQMNSSIINRLLEVHQENENAGLISANCLKQDHVSTIKPMEHGDGSFSCFMISRQAYDEIGYFDENFKPAYFEDNDYLERAWAKGFTPLRCLDAVFYHFFQGTVKNDEELATQYPAFMQKNLEYFKKKHGKVPEHLPEDIRFK